MTNFLLELLRHFRIVLEIFDGILSSLPQFLAFVEIPSSGFLKNPGLGAHIQEPCFIGDSRAEHDVKLRLTERRGHLVFDDLDPHMASDHDFALLNGFDAADVQANA